ncbi:hypothetical protein ACWGB8_32485 [Kitasatospora sp. NPDC054939]
MRLRNAALCAASALVLALAVPGSAAAADGERHRVHRLVADRAGAPSAVLAAGPAAGYADSYELRDSGRIG